MGSRPLRQYYDDDRDLAVDGDLGPDVEAWRRHRRRFLAEVRDLGEDEWKATTRCPAWDAKDVLCHLVSADSFWVLTLQEAAAGSAPARHLAGFDPTATPASLVTQVRDQPFDAVVARFAASTEALERAVAGITGDGWERPAESPLGHVPARFVVAHAFWDSWTHERDILEPLGRAPAPERAELLVGTWFALLFGGMQGGLLDDAAPVGPGLEAPVTATLVFDELPDVPLAVRYDRGVRIARAAPGQPATAAGSALAFVEGMSGRRHFDTAALPADLVAQLARAAAVL